MPAAYYSTPEAVKTRTGIKPDDLGLDTNAELDTFLVELLGEVSELMDRLMRKSYLAETTIPAGLNGIAADTASDSIREMIATRQTPVVRVDDFAVRVIHSRVLGPDIRERLKLYSAGGGVVSVDVGQADLSASLTGMDYDTSLFLLDPTQQ